MILGQMQAAGQIDKIGYNLKQNEYQQFEQSANDLVPSQMFKAIQKQSFIKPCQKYGLDPKKLQIQHLLKYRNYRRLYNIVANDQTPAQQVFRPNLIKQLYFLLQITPFIEDSLKQSFLNKIQQWYNSNDHKKIQLSKNLDGIVKNALQTKTKQKQNSKICNRPKSGVQWDTNLNSFLRPYTAKIRQNNKKFSNNINLSRPQSSKYGLSTNANTNFVEDEYFKNLQEESNNQNNQLNKNIQDLQQICDIEQQRERSLDFKKKYRTIHPQQEPTYQKLMKLIDVYKGASNRCQTPNYLNKMQINKRKIQSAIVTSQTKNAKILAQKQLNFNNQQLKQQQNQQNIEQINDDEQDIQQINKIDEIGDQEDDGLNLNNSKGNFTNDSRTRQGKINNVNKKIQLYSTLNGVKILRPYTAKQTNIISRLNQYSQLQQNKKVIQSNFDQQCAEKYKEYVKNKNMVKRQILRKSQAKRYMNNFMDLVKVLPSKSNSKISTIRKKQNIQITQNSKQNIEPKNSFDFTNNIKPILNTGFYSPKQSTYNIRKYFENKNKQKIVSQARFIDKQEGSSNTQDISQINKMTFQKRLVSQQIFDPFHKNNIQSYNKQALSEIQKIKQRFGGKLTISTDTLMNALYVDAPYKTVQEKHFQIPNKGYLMIQNNQKKKKRKLKKKTKKSLSKTKR